MKRLLKKLFLIVTPFLLIYVGYVVGYNVEHSRQSIVATESQSSLLTQVNDLRKSKNLSQLVEDPTLNNTALIKAYDMTEKNYFEHNSPDGTKWSEFIQKNRPNSERIGENLSECAPDNNSTIKAWIASPTHYENMIMPDWTKFGTATLWDVDKGCYITVNHFSR